MKGESRKREEKEKERDEMVGGRVSLRTVRAAICVCVCVLCVSVYISQASEGDGKRGRVIVSKREI